MHRRDFTRLSALTTLAAALPTLPLRAQGSRKIGFAPVGLGTISDIFMQAVERSQKCTITGLVSGHADEKAPKYQQRFNIPQTAVYNYENFDEIAKNKAIDAVYIGLPNSMHVEYTIRAAKAGKHVLCEKPMAISSEECRAMIKACKDNNVHLMIGYRVHYDPMWLKLREMARSGAIGEVQCFQGGFYGNMKQGQWRLDRKLSGGGSLMDLGIYPLNAIRWFAGEEPATYAAQTSTKIAGPRFASVEETIEWNMIFPSKVIASSGSSYGVSGPAYTNICGTEGVIQIDHAFGYEGMRYTAQTKSGDSAETNPGKNYYQFTAEADHMADCILNNTTPATPGEEGLADLIAIEHIYKAGGHPIA